jgi:hypothetical protein
MRYAACASRLFMPGRRPGRLDAPSSRTAASAGKRQHRKKESRSARQEQVQTQGAAAATGSGEQRGASAEAAAAAFQRAACATARFPRADLSEICAPRRRPAASLPLRRLLIAAHSRLTLRRCGSGTPPELTPVSEALKSTSEHPCCAGMSARERESSVSIFSAERGAQLRGPSRCSVVLRCCFCPLWALQGRVAGGRASAAGCHTCGVHACAARTDVKSSISHLACCMGMLLHQQVFAFCLQAACASSCAHRSERQMTAWSLARTRFGWVGGPLGLRRGRHLSLGHVERIHVG